MTACNRRRARGLAVAGRTGVVVAMTAVAVLTPSVLTAQSFEGAITVRVSAGGRVAAPPQEMEYLSRGGKVRVNLTTPAGTVALLGLPSEGKTYMVLDSQKKYMEMQVANDSAAVSSRSEAKIIRTGRKEIIAGYECEHVVLEMTTAKGVERIDNCVTKALGPFLNPSATGMNGRMAPWQRQLVDGGGFPLKVTLADGTVALEVIKVEKRRVSDGMFRIPADYSKMEMPRRP